jgi:hypothetical protein
MGSSSKNGKMGVTPGPRGRVDTDGVGYHRILSHRLDGQPGPVGATHASPFGRGTADRCPIGAVIRWPRMDVGRVEGWAAPHSSRIP